MRNSLCLGKVVRENPNLDIETDGSLSTEGALRLFLSGRIACNCLLSTRASEDDTIHACSNVSACRNLV